jgi:Fic family protein
VAQPGSYRAFVPAPLPPVPPVERDDEYWMLLSDADRALGELNGSIRTLPHPDLFVSMYVRKEAALSSQIEGTQASLLDVLEFEAQALDTGTPPDVDEIVNYVAAMNHGLERLATLPVSLRLIREIHARLLAGVRGSNRSPGEFRTTQNRIGAGGTGLNGAAFVPPPPAALPEALAAWEHFLHDAAPMPALERVGLAHAQFETIHPFLDGNGRTGRLLITFLLCERRILARPLLYLSHHFKVHRAEYYARLQAVRDAGDWEGWLKFFLRGVATVAREAAATAGRIMALREAHRALLGARLGRGAATAVQLLERLYDRPIVSVAVASELTGLTYPNANALVGNLTGLGLLREVTGRRRGRRFAYDPYLALFADEPPADEPDGPGAGAGPSGPEAA